MLNVVIFGCIVTGLAVGVISKLISDETLFQPVAAGTAAGAFIAIHYRLYRWKRSSARRKEIVERLVEATKLDCKDAGKILVIRAVDDEASLTLAFGAILNRLVPTITFWIVGMFFWAACISFYYSTFKLWMRGIPNHEDEAIGTTIGRALFAGILSSDWWIAVSVIAGVSYVAIALGRSLYGREMAMAPLECQINSQSAPDGAHLSKVVTLVSAERVRGLRHGIYDFDACASTIAQWACEELTRARASPHQGP
jgi:hypothetical protein